MKGTRAEYKVRFNLFMAATKGVDAQTVIYNPISDLTLEPYLSLKKERLSIGADQGREVDIYARTSNPHAYDLIIEVKNWEKQIADAEIEAFIALKDAAGKLVKKKTGYLLYSENGFTDHQRNLLEAARIMYSDGQKLTSYEEF